MRGLVAKGNKRAKLGQSKFERENYREARKREIAETRKVLRKKQEHKKQ